jgi:hypothetical protein
MIPRGFRIDSYLIALFDFGRAILHFLLRSYRVIRDYNHMISVRLMATTLDVSTLDKVHKRGQRAPCK